MMSMSYEEAAYEEYMDKLYEEHKKIAIEDFTAERLSSYYSDNKLLAEPAFDAFSEAKKQKETNPTITAVFGAIAMEVGLKSIILKPIVYGLVHAEPIASLITELTISQKSMDQYRGLLLHILQDHGGIDLNSLKRKEASKLLWEEIRDVQKIRNAIMHRAEKATEQDADLAIGVASEILETIFPAIVEKFGFHLHDGYRICSDWKCKYKDTPIGKILEGT